MINESRASEQNWLRMTIFDCDYDGDHDGDNDDDDNDHDVFMFG